MLAFVLTIVNTFDEKYVYTASGQVCRINILYNRLQNIGANVKRFRKQRKISQVELSIEVGIDRAYLSEIENGRTNTSISILFAICDALRIDIKDLFLPNPEQ